MHNEAKFSSDLEFTQVPGALLVPEGEIALGGIETNFVSLEFCVCSAVIINNFPRRLYGLFHIFPGQEIDDHLDEQLSRMTGSMIKVIEGSDSRSKRGIIGYLQNAYELQLTSVLDVDTGTGYLRDRKFNVMYRPGLNEISVARFDTRDILTYPAFDS